MEDHTRNNPRWQMAKALGSYKYPILPIHSQLKASYCEPLKVESFDDPFDLYTNLENFTEFFSKSSIIK